MIFCFSNKIALELNAGETVICDGGESLKCYDKNGKLRDTYKLTSKPLKLSKGSHTVKINCTFSGEEPPAIEMQLKGILLTEECAISK